MTDQETPEVGLSYIVVAGGAVGGRKVCELYAKTGLPVIVADNNAQAGEALAASLQDTFGTSVIFEFVDVTAPQSVKDLFQRIRQRASGISHLVSMAGGALDEEWLGLEGSSVDTLHKTTALNLLSHQYLMKYGKELLVDNRQQDRSILLVGSINSLGAWDLPSYSAAKAGLFGLMNGAAHEFTATHKIRINLLIPGTIKSDRTSRQPKNFSILQEHTLLREFPTSAEIAEAALMFTHKLPHCTQQTLIIDSGQTAYAPAYNVADWPPK